MVVFFWQMNTLTLLTGALLLSGCAVSPGAKSVFSKIPGETVAFYENCKARHEEAYIIEAAYSNRDGVYKTYMVCFFKKNNPNDLYVMDELGEMVLHPRDITAGGIARAAFRERGHERSIVSAKFVRDLPNGQR